MDGLLGQSDGLIRLTVFAAIFALMAVIELLRPLLGKGHPELQHRLDTQADAFATALGDVRRPYSTLSPDDRQRIAAAAQALADSLDQVAPALGLAATKTTP